MNFLNILGRDESLFAKDIKDHNSFLKDIVRNKSFLVIGAAGTIGQATVKEIFLRSPLKLHVIDINENNLVELVRDIRSSYGYIEGEFKTFTIDANSIQFEMLVDQGGPYDFVLNLSAMKHVRSEKDPLSLMRMIEVNILNTNNNLKILKQNRTQKYFCVSTDKASDPVNMMGASKRIMEHILIKESDDIKISTARFANVIFSDGSLLSGIEHRFNKKQPISAPHDIKRYFLTPEESGELCLLSSLLGNNKEIFFPKPSVPLQAYTFPEIIEIFLKDKGYKIKICESENEARSTVNDLIKIGCWPCYFFKTDTTGEKNIEQFYGKEETLLKSNFTNIGLLSMEANLEEIELETFFMKLEAYLSTKKWDVNDLINHFKEFLPTFQHLEKGKSLEEKM